MHTSYFLAIAGALLTAVVTAAPAPLSASDACHIDGAQKYICAVLSHQLADAEAIPTTEDVQRTEGTRDVQVPTAVDRQSLILSSIAGPQAVLAGPLYDNRAPVYTVVDARTVRIDYTLVIGLADGALPLTTARIEEYITYPSVQSCLMSYIKVIPFVGET